MDTDHVVRLSLMSVKKGKTPTPNPCKTSSEQNTKRGRPSLLWAHLSKQFIQALSQQPKTQVTSSPVLFCLFKMVWTLSSLFWLEAQCCVSYYGNTVWWLMKTVNLDNTTLKRLRHAFLYCSHFSMAGQDGEE